jgi:hypothetical protein
MSRRFGDFEPLPFARTRVVTDGGQGHQGTLAVAPALKSASRSGAVP